MEAQSINQSQAVYQKAVVRGALENSKYMSGYVLKLIGSISVQQVSDTVYLVRGYDKGKNHPEPHRWVVTAVVECGLYHLFGYTKTDGGAIGFSQQREMHRFFRNMGLKPEYVRGKLIKKNEN